MKKQETLKLILDFLHQAEKLKTVMRHSWLSNGRRESTAEHTWRMALMAMVMQPYLKEKVNLGHVMMLVTVHDLCEVYGGDYFAWKKPLKNKHQLEAKGLQKILKVLPKRQQKEIMDLWLEYQNCTTGEARFAKALDKLEVMIQHNEAGIRKNNKKEIPFNLVYGFKQCEHDEFLKKFRELIKQETLNIYKKHKIDKKLYT